MDKILLLKWNTKGMSPVPRIIKLWHTEGREENNNLAFILCRSYTNAERATLYEVISLDNWWAL